VRVKVHLFVNLRGRPYSTITPVLRASEIDAPARAAKPSPFGISALALWEDDPGLSRLREALADLGIDNVERRELVFMDEELRAAPLLRMLVRRAPRGLGGPAHGTEYDLSAACPCCGTGAVQVSPLVVRRSDVPGRGGVVETAHGEIVVSVETAEAFRDVSGVELRPLRAVRSREELFWLQVIAETELPPWSGGTTGGARERPCQTCGRDGYFDSLEQPLRLAYDAREVDPGSLPDVVRTYECFGNSVLRRESPSDSRFAQPLTLVKPRVRDRLIRAGARNLAFEPVMVVRA